VTRQPGVLLLDDGELHAVARTLDEMEVPYERLSGVSGEIAPPLDLLIATPCRASQVRRGSPLGARSGRPIRIIATDENSPGMRRKLERLGFQILVRPAAHRDVWRLLIERATGAEQRDEERHALSSTVSVSTGRAQQVATVVDISNRGCRLRSAQEFRAGTQVRFEIATSESGELARLSGRVVRVAGEYLESTGAVHSAAMLFDSDLADHDRTRLTALLNRLSLSATAPSAAGQTVLPACSSTSMPGLTLDDETDPPLSAAVEVELQIQPDATRSWSDAGGERRQHSRGAFAAPIVATGSSRDQVLIGREISTGGMRIEAASGLEEGDRFRLAIYGPADMDPLQVVARVLRSDGMKGRALGFEDVSREVATKLEKLVACLPQVESLIADEGDRIGTVVSQILSED
jgi:hypothetical protein